jgi:hypothetical protein
LILFAAGCFHLFTIRSDRPFQIIAIGGFGSGLDEHPLGFIAEKLPLRFRFLKAAIRH